MKNNKDIDWFLSIVDLEKSNIQENAVIEITQTLIWSMTSHITMETDVRFRENNNYKFRSDTSRKLEIAENDLSRNDDDDKKTQTDGCSCGVTGL